MAHDSLVLGAPKKSDNKTAKCRTCGDMYDPSYCLTKNLADKCTPCLRGMTLYMQVRIEDMAKKGFWHPVGRALIFSS